MIVPETLEQIANTAAAMSVLARRNQLGEALEAAHVLLPLGVCALISAVALWGVARLVRAVAVR